MKPRPWHNMADFKPFEYDLVNLLMVDDKVRPGWWTGQTWDSRRTIEDEEVVGWRSMTPPRERTRV